MLKVEYVIFFAAISCLEAAKLPSYIAPCSASDPNLNECARKHAQDALPYVVKGDPKYKLPKLVPLELPEIKITSGNLRVDLFHVLISGFKNAQIKETQFDLKNQHIQLTVYIDNANLVSDYEINGNILILPIHGKGKSNITFVGGTYKYDFDYTLKEKQGEMYLIMKNTKLEFKTERTHFYFENLFGGDNQLGEQMNLFLNENWKDVEQELGPGITQTMSTIITASLSGIFEKVPFKDIILEPNPA